MEGCCLHTQYIITLRDGLDAYFSELAFMMACLSLLHPRLHQVLALQVGQRCLFPKSAGLENTVSDSSSSLFDTLRAAFVAVRCAEKGVCPRLNEGVRLYCRYADGTMGCCEEHLGYYRSALCVKGQASCSLRHRVLADEFRIGHEVPILLMGRRLTWESQPHRASITSHFKADEQCLREGRGGVQGPSKVCWDHVRKSCCT